jgi:hypothetical protein
LWACAGTTGSDAPRVRGSDALREAVRLAPARHPERVVFLSALMADLLDRFEHARRQADLDESIQVGRQALLLAEPGNLRRALCHGFLAGALHARFRSRGQVADLEEAFRFWRAVVVASTAPADVRIQAAQAWGSAAAHEGLYLLAAGAFGGGIALLPIYAWRGVDRAAREFNLAFASTLTSDAAACVIHAQGVRNDQAVQCLERGRAILWAEILDVNTDLGRLSERAPELARALSDVRVSLDQLDALAAATRG